MLSRKVVRVEKDVVINLMSLVFLDFYIFCRLYLYSSNIHICSGLLYKYVPTSGDVLYPPCG